MVKDFDYFVDRDHLITNKIYKTQQKADILWMEQLTSAQGDRWKSIRSTFTPIFTSGKMKAMLVFVQETCKKLTNAMEDCAEKNESFELKEMLGKYSMDTIASCAFGVDSQAFTNKGPDHIISTGRQMMNLVSNFEYLLMLNFLTVAEF